MSTLSDAQFKSLLFQAVNAVPKLAIATSYTPSVPPTEQDEAVNRIFNYVNALSTKPDIYLSLFTTISTVGAIIRPGDWFSLMRLYVASNYVFDMAIAEAMRLCNVAVRNILSDEIIPMASGISAASNADKNRALFAVQLDLKEQNPTVSINMYGVILSYVENVYNSSVRFAPIANTYYEALKLAAQVVQVELPHIEDIILQLKLADTRNKSYNLFVTNLYSSSSAGLP